MSHIIRDKFDFDIGYLIKSPCKECARIKDLPKCINECEILDKIQTKIAAGISIFRRAEYPS
jgi:hypothetical protein